jgi:hypothetical protein
VGAPTGASPGSTGHAITAEHKRFALHQELSMDLSARTVLVTGPTGVLAGRSPPMLQQTEEFIAQVQPPRTAVLRT